MKYKVLIDPLAILDMKEIFLYIAFNESVSSAVKLPDSIESTVFKSEEYRKRGHLPKKLRKTEIKKIIRKTLQTLSHNIQNRK